MFNNALFWKGLFSLYLLFYGYDSEYFVQRKVGYTDINLSLQASVNIPVNKYAVLHVGLIANEPYAEKMGFSPFVNLEFDYTNSRLYLGNLGIGLGKNSLFCHVRSMIIQ